MHHNYARFSHAGISARANRVQVLGDEGIVEFMDLGAECSYQGSGWAIALKTYAESWLYSCLKSSLAPESSERQVIRGLGVLQMVMHVCSVAQEIAEELLW